MYPVSQRAAESASFKPNSSGLERQFLLNNSNFTPHIAVKRTRFLGAIKSKNHLQLIYYNNNIAKIRIRNIILVSIGHV